MIGFYQAALGLWAVIHGEGSKCNWGYSVGLIFDAKLSEVLAGQIKAFHCSLDGNIENKCSSDDKERRSYCRS